METPYGSPFASSLLFDYVAQYMYEADAPPRERRAQALSLDRGVLRELLGQEELGDLLDPDAAGGGRRGAPPRPHGTGAEALADGLRRLGDLTAAEIGDPDAVAELVRTRRAAARAHRRARSA